jgi:hypothetical protein
MNCICWKRLSKNPNAIHLLEQNLDKVCWDYLCENSKAIHILVQHFDKVNCNLFSRNPNAIHLLYKCNLNYKSPIGEELVAYIMNPDRLLQFCKTNDIDFKERVGYF